jgi:hypothetical protein
MFLRFALGAAKGVVLEDGIGMASLSGVTNCHTKCWLGVGAKENSTFERKFLDPVMRSFF